jgi:hypothetical protein
MRGASVVENDELQDTWAALFPDLDFAKELSP